MLYGVTRPRLIDHSWRNLSTTWHFPITAFWRLYNNYYKQDVKTTKVTDNEIKCVECLLSGTILAVSFCKTSSLRYSHCFPVLTPHTLCKNWLSLAPQQQDKTFGPKSARDWLTHWISTFFKTKPSSNQTIPVYSNTSFKQHFIYDGMTPSCTA